MQDAASAVVTTTGAGNLVPASVDALGALLRYGPLGANLALLLVACWALLSLHSLVGQGKLKRDDLPALARLHYALLGAAVLLATLGYLPTLLVRGTSPHHVAFLLSPTRYESEVMEPRVMVAGGEPIKFQAGSGQDLVEGERTYQIDVGRLVEHNTYLTNLNSQLQLHAAERGGSDGR